MALGAKGSFGIARESQYGVYRAPFLYLPFISESISEGIEQVFSEALQRTLTPIILAHGSTVVSGDVSMEIYPNAVGWFLTAALGEPTSSEVTAGVYRHTFRLSLDDWEGGAPLPSLSAEISKDLEEVFRFSGLLCQSLGFGIGIDQKIGLLSATFTGLELDLQTSPSQAPSPVEEEPFFWKSVSIYFDDVAFDSAQVFSLAINHSLEAVPAFGYPEARKFLRNDLSEVRVSLTVLVEDLSLFKGLREGTVYNLRARFEGDEIAGGEVRYLEFELPVFRLISLPINISGPGYLTATAEGVGLWSRSEGSALIVRLQNSQRDYSIYW
jgi:hypothetical protein